MSVIDIEVGMLHVRADEEDRSHVQLLLDAAEESAAEFLNRSFYADSESRDAAVLAGTAGSDPIVITKTIVAACLLIMGSLYANREDVVVGTIASELPMGSRFLLTPLRIGLGV